MDCPKCDADVSDSYEPAIDAEYEPLPDDVPIVFNVPGKKLGTPLSELSTQPGTPGFERFKAFARSWGYD